MDLVVKASRPKRDVVVDLSDRLNLIRREIGEVRKTVMRLKIKWFPLSQYGGSDLNRPRILTEFY